MSMKFEDYGIAPEWARDKRIVSEAKFPLGAKLDSICSHCNNFIAVGESHTPVNDLKIPNRDGHNSIKQCIVMRLN